ncbi:Putative pre-mRNA cleavage complex subunit Clp1, P-loop containing nucleoside triphosphate hydrolase [Septoria linicola]|uniref:Polynucleotide 5'-hydroxyl-kinase GRC3 n=1 Tax=Septoria linicola TaxID=215465 RepID=A0A9Q9ENT8_9PEZI|nr:putative pre-mRNA cleavage complex subunit Clp1, P-loop containing nucleoside triphosphate hydrolase [Septoria linicola]USW56954.1 Putative pre-mRNA cleavage complex subunit Clp1, P-loop containing nucleoside triphosphate hydrolase [Septoria linicola]
MALPGLSLPGLSFGPSPAAQLTNAAATAQAARVESLQPQQEWRFEVGFKQQYSIKLESGQAELFGVELAQKQTYTFSGCKGAVFTWQGCQLEVSGNAESEYAGQETEYAVEWLNVHGMLEGMRAPGASDAPRLLVVGPDSVGKSSLVRSLAAWAVRTGHAPTVLNLDSREGLLAPPGSLSIVTVDSSLDIENGYGISSSSGPTVSPVRTPLIYHFPYQSPSEKPEVFKPITTRMALSVMNRLEENVAAKRSGIIIDTPGSLNDPRSNYELLAHVISEFSINMVLTIGSERLASDMSRRFGTNKNPEETVHVLRITKPGGAVERDAAFMKQVRTQSLRQYFFGSSKESLNPHSHTIPFADLDVYRVKSGSVGTSEDTSFAPGADDEDYDVPYANKSAGNSTYEKITPTAAMTGGLVAIKFCSGGSDEQTIRDSAVMGYLHAADVDETRKKIRFLAPHPQRWGDRALVWGHGWPEAAGDLVG